MREYEMDTTYYKHTIYPIGIYKSHRLFVDYLFIFVRSRRCVSKSLLSARKMCVCVQYNKERRDGLGEAAC